ncbi:uncharacterized protein LOC131695121 [Topomyia yanbarensis]|uniref:uncharacterized protein LOC131695121 n=1 Tax=Topomyia yanbarensis TaxID=2498891 RepID=UPI00273B9766|nr:uncharacterized protein LOC131695121 [Topomyia yanbarensis]
MASASTISLGDPPPGDPPESISRNGNERTMPEWMDHLGTHGQRIVLQLRAAGEGSLPKNPFIVGKSIETTCGGKIESAHTEERGSKYVLKTRSVEQARKLMRMNKLMDGTEVVVDPHPTLNRARCVVSCRDAIDVPTDVLTQELKSLGVVDVRRITRKVENNRVNTPTLILTFHGTTFPKHIYFGPLRVETRELIPNPMICFNCCSYGHTKDKCPNAAVCQNCSGPHKLEQGACKNTSHCKNCQDSHSPTSRKCPMYIKEERIIKLKVEKGISFGEARKEYSKQYGQQSYAAVCGAQDRLDNIRKNDEIRLLREEVLKLRESTKETEKDTEIQKLRNELTQMKTLMSEFNKMKEELEKLKNMKNVEHPEISADEQDQTMSDASDYKEDKAEKNAKSKASGSKRKIYGTDSETDPRGSADEKSMGAIPKPGNSVPIKKGRGRPRKH